MAFGGILLVMGIMGAALIGLLLWVAGLLAAGLLEGLLVSHMGKALSAGGPAMAGQPPATKAYRVMGRVATAVCGAALLGLVTALVSSFSQSGGPAPLFMVCLFLLVMLGFLLFLVMGFMLISIYRLARRLTPAPVAKALPIVCLVLGILNCIAGAISLLTVLVLTLLFS